jgi:hypothetical protein
MAAVMAVDVAPLDHDDLVPVGHFVDDHVPAARRRRSG